MVDSSIPDWAQDAPPPSSAAAPAVPDWAQETAAQPTTATPAATAPLSPGKALLQGTIQQIAPYFIDKNTNLSQGQQVADVLKSGASGAAQTGATLLTAPIDAARYGKAALQNAGEYLGTNAANAITGRNDQPSYSWPQGTVTAPVTNALNYSPQTATGERTKLATSFLGPEVAGKAVGAIGKTVSGVEDVGSVLKTGAQAQTAEELKATGQQLFSGADNTYGQMRVNGAVLNPDSSNELMGNIQKALANKDIIPALSPETRNTVSALGNHMSEGDLSLNHLDQYRRLLNNATGEDSAAAGAVRKAIDDHVNQLDGSDLVNGSPEAVAWLNRGRAEYTRAANFDDVSQLLQKANGNPTKIKTSLNNFLADDNNLRGLLPNEIAALRRASQTSVGENISNLLGKVGFTIIPTGGAGNGVLPLLMAGGAEAGKGAAALAVPHALPLVAAGTVARAGNTLYGRGLAQKAINAIKNRPIPAAPIASEIPESVATPVSRGMTTNYAPETEGEFSEVPQGIPAPQKAITHQPETFEEKPDWNQQKRGGRIKPRTGVIYAKPKSYPALEKHK